MRVFLTGATGYVATAVAAELIGAGHAVLGLARTHEGAAALAARGLEPHRGELADHASLVAGAAACDGVIHCAFIHDFSRFVENAEIERLAVEAMLTSMEGSGKPFIATSGVAMLAQGRLATEADRPAPFGRGATEDVVRGAAARGIRTGIVRLPPSTHGQGDRGHRHLEGHPVLPDAAQHLVEIEAAVQPHGGARTRGGQQVEEAENVRRRRGNLKPVCRAEPEGLTPVRRGGAHGAMCMANRLGQARGARAEHQHRFVGVAPLILANYN